MLARGVPAGLPPLVHPHLTLHPSSIHTLSHLTHPSLSLPASLPSQECNPSAVARLLRQTEATKSRFLDRKFLRRQQRAAGAAARASRMWYVDLDTWMASTVGALPGGMTAAGAGAAGRGAGQGEQQAAVVAEPPQSHSVPVDDSQVRPPLVPLQQALFALTVIAFACCEAEAVFVHGRQFAAVFDPHRHWGPAPGCVCWLQTHCALSGEQFEQFWDEEHQEWRYRDAKMLDSEEAARCVGCCTRGVGAGVGWRQLAQRRLLCSAGLACMTVLLCAGSATAASQPSAVEVARCGAGASVRRPGR